MEFYCAAGLLPAVVFLGFAVRGVEILKIISTIFIMTTQPSILKHFNKQKWGYAGLLRVCKKKTSEASPFPRFWTEQNRNTGRIICLF